MFDVYTFVNNEIQKYPTCWFSAPSVATRLLGRRDGKKYVNEVRAALDHLVDTGHVIRQAYYGDYVYTSAVSKCL